MRRNRRNGVPSFAVLLLLNDILNNATNYGIPLITSLFVAGQLCLFMGYIPVPWNGPWDVCISVEKAYYLTDLRRIVMSTLEHGDDWHLYYNMVSFLWKGRVLEKRMGSIRFFTVLTLFIVLTSYCYLGLNLLLFELTGDRSYIRSCAVGFSGVIFALKVLVNHYTPSSSTQSFMGIPVRSKYTYWAELIMIQLISPHASFVGHLAGILVGLMYIKGPLKKILDSAEDIFNLNNRRRPNYRNWSNYTYTHDEDEDIRRATEESLREFNRRF